MTDKLPTTPVDEAQTVFNDPPNILVLRRKAIRMFPRGQFVATYRNDNYNIDLALPYTPGDHSKKSIVATSEAINEAMSDELKKIRKERGMFKRDLSRQEDRFETTKQRLDWAKRALAGHIKKHGKTLDAIGEALEATINEESSTDTLFGSYLHKPEKHIETRVSNSYGHKALHHFIRAAAHYAEGDHETANHHYQAFKRSVSEESVSEIAIHSPDQIADYKKNPENYKRDQNAKLLKYFKDRGRPVPIIHVKEDEDTIMEATIHSLHTINKTQHPASVRFRDGSTAMIDHPTAAQIMHLHSKVNRLNKKKIESLINSGPMGIRKVSTFIKDHMKIGK